MKVALEDQVRQHLRAIPDYPTPGILFQDITPVLGNAHLLRQVTERMAAPFLGSGVTMVLGVEARGFILGSPVALALGAGFVPVRKPGKLPWTKVSRDYTLEYGSASIEAHADALGAADRVLVVDDVLATGGTAAAAAELVRELGGRVAGWSFLLEIGPLGGRARLGPAPVEAFLSLP